MIPIRYADTLEDLEKYQIGVLDPAVTTLMSRSSINWKWKVQPEQRLSIEFADELRKATSQGRLKAVWCHVANESKRSIVVGLILKAMGMIPGACDFWFIGANNGCLIELKRPDENLPKDFKDNQKLFSIWAEANGVPVYLHNTVSGALESLREEGLLI